MSERLTRKEIEERLEQTSESMSRRVDSLERVVRPGRAVRARLGSVPVQKIVTVAAVGLALGWLVARVGRRVMRRRRTADGLAEDVADLAMRERERGADERSAIKQAVRDRLGSAPVDRVARGGGLTSFVMGYAVRTAVHAVIGSLVNAWTNGAEGGSDASDA